VRQDDFDDFSAMLMVIADYCGKQLSPGVISLYWQGLQDLDIDAVRKALNAHVQNPDTGQYMPKIADIRRMLGGTTRDAALMAWNKVQEAVGRAGGYRSVCFDDPIINRAVHDMGGWPEICTKGMDELPFVERNFCDRYRAYKTHGGAPGHPAYLLGLCEAQNVQGGFKSEPPMLVGDAESARRVMLGGSSIPLIPVTLSDHAASVLRLVAGESEAAA
jgi:hypothetical protein